jgi:hypothetical protein
MVVAVAAVVVGSGTAAVASVVEKGAGRGDEQAARRSRHSGKGEFFTSQPFLRS